MKALFYMAMSAGWFAAACIWVRLAVESKDKAALIPGTANGLMSVACMYAAYLFA